MSTFIYNQPTIQQVQAFDVLVAFVLQTVAASTARIYGQTFALWRSWCLENSVQPLDVSPALVLDFLSVQNVAKVTRQRQMTALRKLTQIDYILSPTVEKRLRNEALKAIKVPNDNMERAKPSVALSDADKLLRVWAKPTNMHRRNRALIAVMMLVNFRRSEVATLLWRDVNFETGVLTSRHGKGDKIREVPLTANFALEALRAWQVSQLPRRWFIFCPLERGDKIGEDKPISGSDVYRIVKMTEDISGIEIQRQDDRSTILSDAMATGNALATVQAAVRRAQGEMPLSPTEPNDGRRARRTSKRRV